MMQQTDDAVIPALLGLRITFREGPSGDEEIGGADDLEGDPRSLRAVRAGPNPARAPSTQRGPRLLDRGQKRLLEPRAAAFELRHLIEAASLQLGDRGIV